MENAYLSITQRLKQQVPDIKYIDWDNDQLDDPEAGNYPPDFPCVLIALADADPTTVGENIQEIDTVMAIRIGFIIPENMNSLTPEHIIQTGINRFRITKQVHAALQGYIGSNFNGLDRINIAQENHVGGVLSFVHSYQTLLADNTAAPQWDHTNVELKIDIKR